MKDKILKVLEEALEEIKPMLSGKVIFSEDLQLSGSKGCMDSMALVAYIATVEELLAVEFNREFKLVNDRAFSRGNSPFYSVSTFLKFIEELEQGDGK